MSKKITEAEAKLPIIGHERALINALAKQIRKDGTRGHAQTPLVETSRGCRWEVLIYEGTVGRSTGRVARIEITFDRVEDEVRTDA